MRAIVLWVAAGVVLAVLFRAESSSPILFFVGRMLALSTLALVFVVPGRWIILPLMLLMVSMPDLTQVLEDVNERGVVLAATAWQIRIGSLSPAITVMGTLIAALIRLNDRKLPGMYHWVIFYFCTVPVLTALYFGYVQESLGRFATDAKLTVFFCTGLLLFSSYYRRYPDELLRGGQLFLALACGVVMLDAAQLFVGMTEQMSLLNYVNLSLDSTKGLIVGVIFWLVARMISGCNLLLGPIVGVVTLSVLLAYQTRWLVVMLIVGALLVFLVLGLKRLVFLLILGLLLSVATLPFLQRFFPQVWEVTAIRFQFVGEIVRGADLMEVESERTGAIYNSLRVVADRDSLMTGMGYGSWYTDSYFPMPGLSVAAFDEQSLESGRYYRVHDFVFHFIFKFGLIGLFLYTFVFLRPLYRIWKMRQDVLKQVQWKQITIVIFGLMPMVLTSLWFSGKGLLFSAWFVVAAGGWSNVFRRGTVPHANATANLVAQGPSGGGPEVDDAYAP